ncbi:MAG TPA: YbaB/EbfC family nucleoid-associated protein [Pseudonocardiaceae bacterium]|nr:YbaB/EbfC family nucleoid-associated protein [Pseudonocardiaceae bacterium]
MTHSGAGDPSAGFDAQILQLRARAESAQEQIQSATATVRSPDGAVTVTVGAGGAVTDVRFGERAYERPPQQLAALLMQSIGKAQQQVSASVVTAFGGLVGENSAAMDLLAQFLPADPDADPDPDGDVDAGAGADDQPVPPPPPRPPDPPAAPPRAVDPRAARGPSRRPQRDEHDEDFDNPW